MFKGVGRVWDGLVRRKCIGPRAMHTEMATPGCGRGEYRGGLSEVPNDNQEHRHVCSQASCTGANCCVFLGGMVLDKANVCP
jgi:hypothetical protein